MRSTFYALRRWSIHRRCPGHRQRDRARDGAHLRGRSRWAWEIKEKMGGQGPNSHTHILSSHYGSTYPQAILTTPSEKVSYWVSALPTQSLHVGLRSVEPSCRPGPGSENYLVWAQPSPALAEPSPALPLPKPTWYVTSGFPERCETGMPR
ncbi:unnamed protein product [Spirodela intermedia]|uniref:Uncharacterized protein n=1 Tax=Spirodela intermedia TaxID=51605 RepID=A0A7I8KZS0_SPIIN|nr:unnamed protein product [Spirodela intermedia]